ncbi:prepilin peptidase [Candidatus Pantoea bituminis]|uniref:prepilin peptidase n=1 Tax=Candidatus Pantoea bituminis TaxID=2831036 RepID=UPI001C05FEE3|nr:A24 family peptidase [Pantoea bituminis]
MDVDIITGSITVLIALSAGSFINVVVYRLPLQLLQPTSPVTLCRPRSHCPDCKTPLRWRDNLPLLSWLLLRGKCFHCQAPISLRYPLTEALTLLIGVVSAWQLPQDRFLIITLVLCWTLLALTLIDIKHQLLPDALTLPLLWLGLLLHVYALLPGSLGDAVIGAAAGYSLLWLLATSYRCLRRCEGLGMGDAKLLAALGAWLGWQSLPELLLIAAGGGLTWMLLNQSLFNQALSRAIPFGPWLSLAGADLYFSNCLSRL